jgi:hypothetical protein
MSRKDGINMKRILVTLTNAASINFRGIVYPHKTGAYTFTVTDEEYDAFASLKDSGKITIANEASYVLPANAADDNTDFALTNKIKEFLLDNGFCRTLYQLVADTHYTAPEAGSASGKTKIATLNLTKIQGATKWMVKVQADAFTAPELDTAYEDSTNYTAGADITIEATQHLLLLATDTDGKVKGYVDLTVAAESIKA